EESPLRQAPDAIVIDNSNLTKDEQFDLVLGMARALIR
ncbi:MAG: cytidylate kinase, partial [Bacteroidetes bacterium HGW-Bacteroidetes-15]